MTLVANASEQVAFITRGSRSDSAIPDTPGGIPAASVNLTVLGPDSMARPLSEDGTEGRYRVALTVFPDRTYRLLGSIEGRAVEATTQVPASFGVLSPAEDSIRVTGMGLVFKSGAIPFRFLGTGVACLHAQSVGEDGRIGEVGLSLNETSDSLLFQSPRLGRWIVELYGLNLAGCEWLMRPNPRGNVSGRFGGFAAALLRTKVLVIE